MRERIAIRPAHATLSMNAIANGSPAVRFVVLDLKTLNAGGRRLCFLYVMQNL
ncbi:hypothetical protein H7C19_23145 [Cohnella nanjingensis]|uniref:Uncharacterized protein n=1 Tax=Cohnella nanjingensis TaxID=1387779 RepID=A0A7X0RU11_9BACL|nr:hypothetical protein [Cohnella nanjingensis]